MNLSNVTAQTALALSDGTSVEFVKITSKDNIQVRLPTSHPLGADDPLRIFRRDGTHYKNETDLTLLAVAPAAALAAAAASAAAVANDNRYYEVEGATFDNFDDAKNEAIDLFRDGGNDVEIIAISRTVVGKVGFTSLAA